ncbi:MAG TPA: site-2 protease family protein, partial [Candidatus Dormibacteraeota bacterium]|nr:site-2 protease family protein [Candidatus Dormibacteraeota bacterium]
MQDPLDPTPQGGEHIPPRPPIYPVTADIPPQSPYHQSPQPRSSNRNTAGWLTGLGAAAIAFLKYGGLLLLKIPALGTLITVVISFGAYALAFGPGFAVALISMLFVHEMGHVIEIRRQGMRATAPIFIPFLGAAIFQRSHPSTALKQAQIGIAGPIAGTIGATAAFFLYLSTGSQVLLLAALIGFGLNLFNLIPVWQLDGSWVLAPVSKWVYVAGYGLVV